MNKKAYIQPATRVLKIMSSNLLITVSCGRGVVELDYDDEEGDASEGMSRQYTTVWDDEEDEDE